MASYRISIKTSAVGELEGIPDSNRSRIIYLIQGLAEDPRPAGCEKLSGYDKYRLRQGRYSILYRINGDEVILTGAVSRH
ncbi:MAG: type II toxin-antitoxin system RelE/ParE family toxin [bacterium]